MGMGPAAPALCGNDYSTALGSAVAAEWGAFPGLLPTGMDIEEVRVRGGSEGHIRSTLHRFCSKSHAYMHKFKIILKTWSIYYLYG